MTHFGAKLLPYLRPYRLRFAWALLQVFLIAGFELLKPWPLQGLATSTSFRPGIKSTWKCSSGATV